jgi:hypothetical protein
LTDVAAALQPALDRVTRAARLLERRAGGRTWRLEGVAAAEQQVGVRLLHPSGRHLELLVAPQGRWLEPYWQGDGWEVVWRSERLSRADELYLKALLSLV